MVPLSPRWVGPRLYDYLYSATIIPAGDGSGWEGVAWHGAVTRRSNGTGVSNCVVETREGRRGRTGDLGSVIPV